MKYVSPVAELVDVELVDIIMTSTGGGEGEGDCGEPYNYELLLQECAMLGLDIA